MTMTPVEVAKATYKHAHKIYLDNWETKTLFAENDCVWNIDIQHRNHEAIEKLASTSEHLAHMLEKALARIDELETQVSELKK